ncbi:hypothetical protein TrCOL_g13355 [Triparma columacea]|uniref:Uncharacterized protein n=1 Tax=Triparma columacea TaxID=722753 RepID=A0A9W7GNL8_9STRA|nr:hypothetical protein TrCOL_g13355 [Triparma columacea]
MPSQSSSLSVSGNPNVPWKSIVVKKEDLEGMKGGGNGAKKQDETRLVDAAEERRAELAALRAEATTLKAQLAEAQRKIEILEKC